VEIPAAAGPTSVTHQPALIAASCSAGDVTYESNRVAVTVDQAPTTRAAQTAAASSPPAQLPSSAASSPPFDPTGALGSPAPSSDAAPLAPAASPVNGSPKFTG
jgi:hypothetical protein